MLTQTIDGLFPPGRRVLVAGAGGGFDLVAGLPVALALEGRGCEVHLANLSFTALAAVEGGTWHDEVCLTVTADSATGESYCPEIHLSGWFRHRGREVPVHCLRKVGGRPLGAAYAALAERLAIDALVLVDGGVDAFLRGDEFSLGTPTLDALSVSAGARLDLPVKVLASLAFGAERWDRICHAQALRRFAELTRGGALLGVETLLAAAPETRDWLDAVRFVHGRMGPILRSIVVSSMEAAVAGKFGDTRVNARTETTPIWISPLTALVWYFDLDAVARAKPFLGDVAATATVEEAARIVEAYHRAHQGAEERIPL